MVRVVSKYVGEGWVPQDVKRRRRQIYDAMRRFGTPVLVKKMLTDKDMQAGIATTSPVYDTVYGQTRNDDPISHGIGYVSTELSADEWYDTSTGQIVKARTTPGNGWVQAPKYRGFGEGFLTFIIEPDNALDFFRLNEVGALIKVQTATAQAPWYPDINDNDLIVNVVIDNQGNIVDSQERYQAKMTNPVSLRGLDRRGRREYAEDGGNRFVVNQSFEMTLIPDNDYLYNVEVDR